MAFMLPLTANLEKGLMRLRDRTGRMVGNICFPDEAAFAVKAVNNHDKLVEALEEARGALDELMGDTDLDWAEDDSPEFRAMQKISTALAALKGA